MIRTGLIWSVVCIAVMMVLSVIGWQMIPEGEMIARHWGLDGEPNGYSPRNEFLLMMPLMALGITVLLAVLPLILPRRDNLEKSAGFYTVAWLGTMVLLTVIHGAIIHSTVTGDQISNGLIMVVAGVFIALIGNYMAKSKSNWVAGLRNPWTLTSEHAWTVGNRLGGYLFVATGLATILLALTFGMQQATFMLIGGTLSTTVIASVASYFAWRNDSEARQE